MLCLNRLSHHRDSLPNGSEYFGEQVERPMMGKRPRRTFLAGGRHRLHKSNLKFGNARE
jgi:hypothetical protein